jgi:hypothetical protein
MANRVDQIENSVSGKENKVKKLHLTVKDNKRILRKYE